MIQSQVSALEAIKLKQAADIEFQFRRGIKFALRKEGIEDQVNILNRSADDLNRLLNVSASLYQMNVSPRSNNSRRLAKSLGRVRNYADRLYSTISASWNPNCHPIHEAKLILEDRVDEESLPKKSSNKRRQALRFLVVFTSEPSAGSDVLWHESEIKVIDENDSDEKDFMSSQSASLPSASIKVTFSGPPLGIHAHHATTEVEDICLTVGKAKREQKRLQLYLNARHRFHCHHISSIGIHSSSGQARNTISLEALLSASNQAVDLSKRLPIHSRLLLALNLASTLLQLNATPWLASSWSKSTVCFLAPSTLSNHSQIDLTRPLISVRFDSGAQSTGRKECPQARQVILELGIMLLELWHETTFEAQCAAFNVTVGDEYFERVKWAQKWLEASSDSGLLLPDYINFVSRCIKCNFENTASLNPTWESDQLIQGFITGVLEPLRKMCRGSEG